MDRIIGRVDRVCKECGHTVALIGCEGGVDCSHEDEMCSEGCPRAMLVCKVCGKMSD
jgi:hypothetical protein